MESQAPVIHHYGKSNGQLPDNLDEHIIHHRQEERFVDTPAFVVLVLAVMFVIGCVIGIFLAL